MDEMTSNHFEELLDRDINITERKIRHHTKHNEQYPKITIHKFANAHDRFPIVDDIEIYQIGGSIKDRAKRWFAFSKFEKGAVKMLEKLEAEG